MILTKEGPLIPTASGWSTSGGSGISDDELRRQIRVRLSEARLPAVNGVSKSHPGTGRPCIVCRRAIEPTEVERQLDGVGIVLIAHEEAIAGNKVRMTFRVVLPRPVAEALATRAIWEEKNIGTQVTEILEAADYSRRT